MKYLYWSAKQKDPSEFTSFTITKNGEGILFVNGLREDSSSTVQSVHFDKSIFQTKQETIGWLKSHSFDVALEESESLPIFNEAKMISFEKISQLLQEAVDAKYPLIADPNGNDPYDWCHRFSVMRVFENEAILRRGWEHIDENDPQYLLINYTVDKDKGEVALGEESTALALKFTSEDGKKIFSIDESTDFFGDNISEAGKRNSKTDATSINNALKLLMNLISKDELSQDNISSMSAMCATDAKKPVYTKEEEEALEAWDGSKSKYTPEQLMQAVPRAMATWAKKKAGTGKSPAKGDLHLPYKDPDGTVNQEGVSAALQRIDQVKGVPSDVIDAARRELQAASKKHKSDTKESIESEEAKNDNLVEWNSLGGEIFEETIACTMEEASFDEATGIIKNVDILGPVSKNGRRYPESTQKEAKSLFEGAKAYLNHQSMSQIKEARRMEDMIGHYSNVTVKNGKTKGDLHLIMGKDVVEKHVIPVVKNAPHLAGNSIVARGQMTKADDGVYEVNKILGVRSVDLVSEPATTDGLFSESVTEEKNMAFEMKDLTLAQIKEHRPDLLQEAQVDTQQKERVAKLEKDVQEAQGQLVEKDKEIISLKEEKNSREKSVKIATAINEAKLPDSFRYEANSKTIKSYLSDIMGRCATDDEMKMIVNQWEESFEAVMKETQKSEKSAKMPVSVEKKAVEGADGELKESDVVQLYHAFNA